MQHSAFILTQLDTFQKFNTEDIHISVPHGSGARSQSSRQSLKPNHWLTFTSGGGGGGGYFWSYFESEVRPSAAMFVASQTGSYSKPGALFFQKFLCLNPTLSDKRKHRLLFSANFCKEADYHHQPGTATTLRDRSTDTVRHMEGELIFKKHTVLCLELAVCVFNAYCYIINDVFSLI